MISFFKNRIALSCAAALATASSSQAGLIAHYNGEDTSSPLVDQVGSQTASATGSGHQYGLTGPSNWGNAIGRNGQGSWQLSNAESVELRDLSNDFTVAAWVYLDSAIIAGKTGTNEDLQRIMGDDVAWDGDGWAWGVSGSRMIFTKNGVDDYLDPSNTFVPSDQWVHLAVTVSSATGVNFFMNATDLPGILSDTRPVLPSGAGDIYGIGRAYGSGLSQWFGGRLDEVRVYDHVLTQSEIDELVFLTSDPDLSVTSSFSFAGVVGTQSYTIPYQNNGATQNLIFSPSPTLSGANAADFSITSYDTPLSPGASGDVNLSFTPSQGIGSYSATLTLNSNDPNVPAQEIAIDVMVTDPFQMTLVDGYTDFLSYDPGDVMKVYLNSTVSVTNARINLYDMENQLVLTHRANVGPQSVVNPNPWENGYGYPNFFEFTLPHLRSGVYRWEDNVHFMVRDPERDNRITVVYETNTKNSYTTAGGKSTYASIIGGSAATKVSFRRPQYCQKTWNLLPEFYWHGRGFHRWLRSQRDLDIGYLCDYDLDDYNTFKDSDLLILPGHSEYWTRAARTNFDQFLADGKNVLNFSGNSQWGQVRYEGPDDSTMVLFKRVNDPHTPNFEDTTFYEKSSLNFPQMPSIGVQWAAGDYPYSGNGWISNKTDTWDVHYPALPPEPTLANWPTDRCKYGGFKVLDDSRPYFQNTGLSNGDIIHMITHEHDGMSAVFSGGEPDFHPGYPSFNRKRIVGWEEQSPSASTGTKNIGPILELQRTAGAGLLINTNSTDWASENSFYHSPDHLAIRTLTRNMIDFMAPPEPTVTPIAGGLVRIEWKFGVLQSSTNGTTWTDHPGATTSPYNYNPGSQRREFRARFDFAD